MLNSTGCSKVESKWNDLNLHYSSQKDLLTNYLDVELMRTCFVY